MFVFAELDSTQLYAKRIIDNQTAKNHDIILAYKMTNGQTTKPQVQWFAPKGNLHFTYVLQSDLPHFALQFIAAISTGSFVSTATQDEVFYKWPNDIIVKNKKICGILPERYKNFFLIGISINIQHKPEYTNNLLATCVYDFNKNFQEDVRDICSNIVSTMNTKICELEYTKNYHNLIQEWKKKAWKLGDYVKSTDGELVKFIDISGNGEMIYEKDGYEYTTTKFDITHSE